MPKLDIAFVGRITGANVTEVATDTAGEMRSVDVSKEPPGIVARKLNSGEYMIGVGKFLESPGHAVRKLYGTKFTVTGDSDGAYDYNIAKAKLQWLLDDMRALAGDTVGPSGQTWQQVATNLAENLRDYANLLEAAVAGKVRKGPAVFPSPDGE